MFVAQKPKIQLSFSQNFSGKSSGAHRRVPDTTRALGRLTSPDWNSQGRRRRSWPPANPFVAVSTSQSCKWQAFAQASKCLITARFELTSLEVKSLGRFAAVQQFKRGFRSKAPRTGRSLSNLHTLASGSKRKRSDLHKPKQLVVKREVSTAQLSNGITAENASTYTLQRAIAERNASRAFSAFNELQADSRKYLSIEVCNMLLQLLSNNFKRCRGVYAILRDEKMLFLTPLTTRMVLDSAIKAQDLKAAVDVFRDMQKQRVKPGIISWCYLISNLTKIRRKGWPYQDIAYELWKEVSQEKSLEGKRDGMYYATGLSACTGIGEMEEAERLIPEMQAAGLQVDIRAFNILLTGYSRLSDLPGLEQAFVEIQKMGLRPDRTTFNILVNAYVDADRHTEAQRLEERAATQGFEPDLHTYSSLIKSAVRQNNLERALQLYDYMLKAAIEPSVVTANILIDGLVRQGKMSDAEDFLKSVEQRGLKSNVVMYNTVLRGYANEGNTRAVREVLQRMLKSGINLREDTFNTLMTGALQNDNMEVVPNMFSQLLSLDLRPDSLSYTALITALARLSRPEAAVTAALELEQRGGLDLIATNALVGALANGDRLVEAEQYLKRAVDITKERGLAPPVEAYGALVKTYARLNDVTAALDLLSEFRQKGGKLDDRMISMGVTACVRAGEFRKALKFVRAMEKAGENIDKARIKSTLVTVVRLQEQYYRERSRASPRNENLERFKFWLGLPNQYYSSEYSFDESDSISDSYSDF